MPQYIESAPAQNQAPPTTFPAALCGTAQELVQTPPTTVAGPRAEGQVSRQWQVRPCSFRERHSQVYTWPLLTGTCLCLTYCLGHRWRHRLCYLTLISMVQIIAFLLLRIVFISRQTLYCYSCGLSTTTIEYLCPSVCLSVCVCVHRQTHTHTHTHTHTDKHEYSIYN